MRTRRKGRWLLKQPRLGGHSKQTIDGLEDIKTFFTKAVIKFIVI